MVSVPAASTRGFLFADLRGYTRFVETRGDLAAVELLATYRSLVRKAVERFGGAEIRTEGDSFYIVFPSASSAVEGGLAILHAAAVATGRDAAHPVNVGIGVHAGETTDTAEGYVGSAVNIAARVCAQAVAGELLVTDTVRSLTRSRLAIGFRPRGTPRLKGIEEPIALFAVVLAPESSAPGALGAPASERARARRSVPKAVVATTILVVALAIGVTLAALGAQRPSATPGPSVLAVASNAPSGGSRTPEPISTTFPTAAETILLAALPPNVRATCVRGRNQVDLTAAGFSGQVTGSLSGSGSSRVPNRFDVLPPPAQASLACLPPGGPTGAWFLWYPLTSDSAAEIAVADLGTHDSVSTGDCTKPPAQGSWRNDLGASGSLLCLRDSGPYGQPWIYWSFGSAHVLGVATAQAGRYKELYDWWRTLTPFLN